MLAYAQLVNVPYAKLAYTQLLAFSLPLSGDSVFNSEQNLIRTTLVT